MLTGNQLSALASAHGLRLRGRSKAERAMHLAPQLTIDQIASFCLKVWQPPPLRYHLGNLTSGLLKGHSWHRAAPSRLHLSLQDRVRALTRSQGPLTDFLEVGKDIAKHEYFIVAIADLCEHALVTRCGAFPAIAPKSLSDVVLDGIPYDVKNVSSAADWPIEMVREDPVGFAAAMILGADAERTRRQAEGVGSDAPFNRLFIVVQDDTSWLDHPEQVLEDLVKDITAGGIVHRVQTEYHEAVVRVVAIS